MSPDDPGTALLLEVLERSRARGFLGEAPLDAQIRHALGFAWARDRVSPPAVEGASDPPLPGGPPQTAFRGTWMDLGSGGGLPGLVLAAYWPNASAILLDSATRRTDVLVEAVRTLGWEDRVQVVRARAEDAGRDPGLRGRLDVVVARSFGPPAVTAECAAPFLVPDGLLVVSEPPSDAAAGVPGPGGPARDDGGAASERWPPAALAELGLEAVARVQGMYGYQVLRQRTPCPERFPRRPGIPSKRPLWRSGTGSKASP